MYLDGRNPDHCLFVFTGEPYTYRVYRHHGVHRNGQTIPRVPKNYQLLSRSHPGPQSPSYLFTRQSQQMETVLGFLEANACCQLRICPEDCQNQGGVVPPFQLGFLCMGLRIPKIGWAKSMARHFKSNERGCFSHQRSTECVLI